MTPLLTSSPRKKLIDEGSFQELLAAAFVLQQHNELASSPSASSTEVLSAIVRIQRLIRAGHSNLVATAKLISQQVQKFTQADGVAIGIVTDDEIIYLAAIGTASHDLGLRVALHSGLSAHCIRTGLTFQSFRAQDDPRMLFSLCDQGGVKSFIAVPVGYQNKVVGVLEARFKTWNAFTDDEVRTCELMAGLVKEVITQAGKPQVTPVVERETELEPQSAPSEESFSVKKTETLPEQIPDEKHEAPSIDLEPGIKLSSQSGMLLPPVPADACASETAIEPVVEATIEPAVEPTIEPIIEPAIESGSILLSPSGGPCRGCGQHLTEDELFCGKCGTERTIRPDGPLQSKWASLWYMNQGRQAAGWTAERTAEQKEREIQPVVAALKPRSLVEALPAIEEISAGVFSESSPATIAADTDVLTQEATTESATHMVRLEWLPDIAASQPESWLRHHWRVNRANFYLGGAALLLMVVLFGRGTSAVPDSAAAAKSSGPSLTLFERMLVGMGIAEAPQTPAYNGNPDTPVWVDLHTALYYCPGSDLYGKTDGGKIATQRSAQLDQFEPAHRKACN